MNKFYLNFILLIALNFQLKAQVTIDFENVINQPDTFLISDGLGNNNSFAIEPLLFPSNYINTGSFGYWEKNFAISSMTDSITSGYLNEMSARPGKGANNSMVYSLCYSLGVIKPYLAGDKININSLQITNNTFAANSMRDGDMFAKKFGGTSGNDTDYFKVIFTGYLNGIPQNAKDEFYLADYRFSNNAMDYIVTQWRNFNPTTLVNVDSVVISFESTDVGSFGINTPTYVCLDNIVSNINVSVKNIKNDSMNLAPNPANDFIYLTLDKNNFNTAQIIDLTGKEIITIPVAEGINKIDIQHLPNGIYFIKPDNKNISKFIKQ